MLHCKHCNVALPGEPLRCPLCQNPPSGIPDDSGSKFPSLPPSRLSANKTLLVWIAFGTICVAAICASINLIYPTGGWWSLFVAIGIISLWVDFSLMLKKRKNLPKSILWQVVAISGIAFLWDLFTGYRGWSLDYVLPILCTCAMVAMTVIARIRKLSIQDYILYLVVDCILGIVSLALILTGVTRIVIPSAICFGSSIIFLAFLFIFEGKALIAEMQRRMHL